MKLIAEYTEQNLEVICEAKENGEKKYTIEGVFAQAEAKNRNGRIYPRKIMESAVEKYVSEQVSKNRAVGELNHPDGPTVNLDKVSHRIEELRFEGNDVIGKASILDTPMGQIVKGLLDGGVRLGVSTRGMGSLEERNGTMYVKEDFMLNAVDIVQDPSAPNAFVNGIMEGVEFFYDEENGLYTVSESHEKNNGIIEPRQIEEAETEIKRAPSRRLYETQVREFKNFLSSLKKNI